jgi:hypothetical protein
MREVSTGGAQMPRTDCSIRASAGRRGRIVVAVIVGGMRVPEKLIALIDAGRWPRRSDLLVHHEFLVPRSLLAPFCSSDFPSSSEYLHLFPPTFALARPTRFWTNATGGWDIDLKRLLDIADFGWGTDAPIILDYRRSEEQPSVRCLRYPDAGSLRSEWVDVADSFDDLVTYLGLETVFAGVNGKFAPNEGRCFYWHEDATPKPTRCDEPVVARGYLRRTGYGPPVLQGRVHVGFTPPADACATHVDLIWVS